MSNRLINELTRSEKADAFSDLIDSRGARSIAVAGGRVSRAALIECFKNSDDILCSASCEGLGLRAGATYAQATRALKAQAVH
jgi:hypothetical protein